MGLFDLISGHKNITAAATVPKGDGTWLAMIWGGSMSDSGKPSATATGASRDEAVQKAIARHEQRARRKGK